MSCACHAVKNARGNVRITSAQSFVESYATGQGATYGATKSSNAEDVVISATVYVESSVFVSPVTRMTGLPLLKFSLVRKTKTMHVSSNYQTVNTYLK